MALVIGTGAAETLGGSGEDDLIVGLGGDDTLNGLEGNDTLDGGAGNDLLIGGGGDDLYVVDSAADVVGEGPDGGTDTVLAFATYTLAENSNTEKFQLAGNLVIDGTGTEAGDVILGNMAANHLTGLGGDDRLVGSFGDDSLEGGEGNDTLSGGPGTDSLAGGAGDDLYIDTLLRAGNSSSGTLSLPGSITEDVEGGNDTLQVRLNAQRMTFTFPDDSAFTMSRVSSATNPIVGSWYASGVGESNSTIAITFFADGSYMLAEDGDRTLDASGKDGMERGSYTWNSGTGAFSATTTVNTNGEWGFSHSNFINLRIDGDSLTIQATDGNLSLERVTSNSSPLVGAWTASNSGESASTVAITFLEDGTFLLAEDGNPALDPSGKDGMERGTYTWNQATGAFTANATVNTNGEWGLSHLGAGVKVSTSHLPVSPFPVALPDNVENLDLSHTGKMRLDGTGNDLGNLMTGNGGVNVLLGGLGDDALDGIGGNDTLGGGAGNDTLNGGAGLDSMAGGAGDDVYFVSQGTDVVTEKSGEGVDTIRSIVTRTLGNHQDNLVLIGSGAINGTGNTMHNVLDGNGLANRLDGKVGNDTLSGAQGNDTLLGGDGDDEIDGGAGNDSMVGGAGNDTYFVNGAGDAVTESANGGTDTVLSSVDRTLGANQENLTLTGSAANGSGNNLHNVINGNDEANLLKGESGNDTINGNGGNDSIEGGSGNDSIDGGAGSDTMRGGSGNDTYMVVFGEGDVVIEDANDGDDTIITDGPIDMAANVEKLVWLNTGGGGGVCNGNDLANVMIVQSGAGTLTMDGKLGSDTVSFEGFGSDAFIDLASGNSTLVDTLTSMENATGGLGNDMLTGNDVANILNGSTGADTMAGGYGGDIYVVDSLLDVVMEADNTEIALVLPGGHGDGLAIGDITDTVRAAINYSLEGVGFVENIVLIGNALEGTGNELDNRIIGNSRNNKLDGLAGIDTLAGAAGNDTLIWRSASGVYNGGGGTDTIKLGVEANINLKNVEKESVLSIERVDLKGQGNNILTVTRQDLLDMSPNDELRVLGDAGDRVNAAGFVAAGASGSFDRYTNGLAVLLVENDVQVVT